MKKHTNLIVAGTKLVVPIVTESLARTTSGSGVNLSNCCAEHKELLKAPRICPACDGPPKDVMKAYKVGGKNYVYLSATLAESLRPKGSDTMEIIQFVNEEELGGAVSTLGSALIPKNQAVLPADPMKDGSGPRRYAALRALLQGRAAVVRVITRKLYYGILRVTDDGLLVIQELHKPRDLKPRPAVKVPELSEAELAAFAKKGESLVEPLNISALDEDRYRDAMEQAIMDAAEGKETAVEEEAEVEASADEDLLSLI